mmetsp:Transcript_25982/g.56351  ORF Transcript_25982/g.56351 Transcript_25982/m.56351 type:complete len:199 (+) Transcript_25982:122-718(+)
MFARLRQVAPQASRAACPFAECPSSQTIGHQIEEACSGFSLSRCTTTTVSATQYRFFAKGRRHNEPPKGGGQRDVSALKASVDQHLNTYLKVLAPKPYIKEEISEEQLAKDAEYAKEYSRKKMNQHRRHQRMLANKLKLQKAAVAALPQELAEAARNPDLTPFPMRRHIWYNTPPITGFMERKMQGDEAGVMGGKKLR